MPCNLDQRITVEFKAESATLLKAALEADGYVVQMSQQAQSLSFYHQATGAGGAFRNGMLTHDPTINVNDIRLAYSKAAVREAARRCGWIYAAQGKQKAKLERRY